MCNIFYSLSLGNSYSYVFDVVTQSSRPQLYITLMLLLDATLHIFLSDFFVDFLIILLPSHLSEKGPLWTLTSFQPANEAGKQKIILRIHVID